MTGCYGKEGWSCLNLKTKKDLVVPKLTAIEIF